MPTLFILAGPNGAGKTTFYNRAIDEGYIDRRLPFINVDVIARNELGGYSEANFVNAAEIARNRIAVHIDNRSDFLIESNLAKSSDYDWILKMKNAGYEVVLYFLCTKDILINIDRVERRVKEGGHYIPAHIVTDRYRMGLIYLKTKLHLFKEVYLIDNTEQTINEIAVLNDGKIIIESGDDIEWVEKLLSIVKKMRH